MTSKKCSLIWVVLFLFMLNLSSKALANEMGHNRKLLSPDQGCKRGINKRITYELNKVFNKDKPHCHNYL
ncbi:unnamed protein product [Trifolium pratense]|uniref:Uncharacterized protein n=1 Tax=Trifolium pratense TaxID=57577 RepID=A0ACB0KFZ4_TRIPR|nr:unnamed protein product [Trifolium pratense]